ncbi:hypothetical protein ABZW44_37140 [Streptomyces mirabilis]|uniref:hypothetical protein n=1 Tax=Streptomyces mirabilis TaxID=68239 RepID=UPI0033AB2C65
MKDVVAVALITALSTVAAGGLAGAFTYRAALIQARNQREQAREGRAEERVVRHREVRREAYVRFLDQLLDAHRYMDQLWTEPLPSPAQPALRQLTEHVDRLWKATTIIDLEGPPDVSDAARAVAGLAAEEWDVLKEYLEGSHGGEELHLSASGRRRAEVGDRLVARARNAVGGHLVAPE